jgi:hypothetical protein
LTKNIVGFKKRKVIRIRSLEKRKKERGKWESGAKLKSSEIFVEI